MQPKYDRDIFVCGTCELRFTTDEDLQRHICVTSEHHVGKSRLRTPKCKGYHCRKPHVCGNCDKHFVLAEYLKIHVRTNYECGKFFNRAHKLKLRAKFCTPEGEYMCPTCSLLFAHFSLLKMHAENQHGGMLHHCTLRSNVAGSSQRGGRVCTHTMKKRYSCVRCSTRHIKAAKITKPFQCQRCPKSFSVNSELEHHIALHYGSDTYSCAKCDKRFRNLASLKKHLASHIKERQYACSICGNRFSRTGFLKVHIMKIHGGVTRNCRKCGKPLAKRGQPSSSKKSK